jgi:GNAT superfamily N-acetyltransferase
MCVEPEFPNNWQLEINPPRSKVEELRDHLRAYNREAGQVERGTSLGIFLRDEDNKLVGGVSAYIWGETAEIDFLWLADNLRGQGVGQRLMAQIEKAVVERGARQAVLTTFSFQAPDFYEKIGYETFATLDGLGNGHKKFYLRKSL